MLVTAKLCHLRKNVVKYCGVTRKALLSPRASGSCDVSYIFSRARTIERESHLHVSDAFTIISSGRASIF